LCCGVRAIEGHSQQWLYYRGKMQERLQKIIGRAGITSRRHAEELIRSGQVSVNGHVVRELGTKADPEKDKIVAAGRVVEAEKQRKVYLVLNKPAEVVSSLADPEGRKTLRNLLRGFPERVYPVGNLEYAATGLVFLTNDGELAARMLKQWDAIEQTYHVKLKGMLTRDDLEKYGKEIGVRMQTLRQPDASRGHAANYWYEVKTRGGKLERLRNVMFREHHPVEKVMRVGMGSLSVEGVPRARYRLVEEKELGGLIGERKKVASGEWRMARKEKKKSSPQR
jgi:23S rRNA pseudouridine2605 synthase